MTLPAELQRFNDGPGYVPGPQPTHLFIGILGLVKGFPNAISQYG